MWFYVNGAFVEEEEAKISVLDRSFLYGDAVFEGIGVWSGRVIHLDDHLFRLQRSARIMRIPLPSLDELRDIIFESGARNEMRDVPGGQFRLQVTRGDGAGVANANAGMQPNIIVIPELHHDADPHELAPRRAVISSYVRAGSPTIDPRLKTTSYATAVLAFLEASDQGAQIGILRDDRGFIAEGQTMNLFCVDGNVVRAPLEVSALAGTTRRYVLEAATRAGFTSVETQLTPYDLMCADELFATSTSLGIMPIASLGGVTFEIPAPGPVTRTINEAYLEHALATSPLLPTPLQRSEAGPV